MDEENLNTQGRIFFENIKLKKQVTELEKKIKEFEARKTKEARTEYTKIIEVMKQKDKKLEDYALELEEKNEKLQSVVEELQGKNAELETWVTVLKLYQDIFQTDESAMIGIDVEKNIIQFNRSAVGFFGSQLEGALLHPVESVGIERFIPEINSFIDKVFTSKLAVTANFKKDNVDYSFKIYPLGTDESIRGVMLKISKKIFS